MKKLMKCYHANFVLKKITFEIFFNFQPPLKLIWWEWFFLFVFFANFVFVVGINREDGLNEVIFNFQYQFITFNFQYQFMPRFVE